MWDGYLDFFVRTGTEGPSAWWAQHNEHRIVLARGLFWLDIRVFGGRSAFLIACNVALLAGNCALLLTMLREAGGSSRWLGGFVVAWLFLWIQNENLTWGFQSQFFFAQLLPLASFYLMHRTASTLGRGHGVFALALACGLLSLGTMANGVLALPLMTAYAIVAKMGWRRIGVLAGLSAASLLIYFYGYDTPSGQGSHSQAVRERPVELLRFIAAYLGGPFAYLAGLGTTQVAVGVVAGAALMSASLYHAQRLVRSERVDTLSLALLAYIVYVGGTAFGTSVSRASLGIAGATTSRYMTPVLMAWAALLLLQLKRSQPSQKPLSIGWAALAALLLIPMALLQQSALKPQSDFRFERRVAALALELGVDDEVQIKNVYPISQRAMSVARIPREANLSIFGVVPFRDAAKSIGTFAETPVANPGDRCVGAIENVEAIAGDAGHLRVTGWFFAHSRSTTSPEVGTLVDTGGRIAGFVLTGRKRTDIAKSVSPAAAESGFTGYLRIVHGERVVSLVDPASGCRVPVDIPPILFRPVASLDAAVPSVDSGRIVDRGAWTGTDSARSSLPGLEVLGSFVASDADTGSLILNVGHGDTLLYRAGPTAGRQFVEIVGSPQSRRVLPAAIDWIGLTFVIEKQSNQVELRFSDEGSAWGEWSAIAITRR